MSSDYLSSLGETLRLGPYASGSLTDYWVVKASDFRSKVGG